MTVKEIAQQTGLTHQAVYKRLKAAGIAVAELKDSKNTEGCGLIAKANIGKGQCFAVCPALDQ